MPPPCVECLEETKIRFVASSIVKENGQRVRLNATNASSSVGTLHSSSELLLSFVTEDTKSNTSWGKLHPEMYEQLQSSDAFTPFDIGSYGWVILRTSEVDLWTRAPV